mmetsp:Transcript_12470/g.17821  ORF Transcript_12470/g.17821 Transcript_12470/m.17821 type:complete len:126 (+) Transcript_12470:1574-1951(+)
MRGKGMEEDVIDRAAHRHSFPYSSRVEEYDGIIRTMNGNGMTNQSSNATASAGIINDAMMEMTEEDDHEDEGVSNNGRNRHHYHNHHYEEDRHHEHPRQHRNGGRYNTTSTTSTNNDGWRGVYVE